MHASLYNTVKPLLIQAGILATNSWTSRVLPSSQDWQSVCWSPELGIFCAVAANAAVAATSPDGITWTQRVLPSSQTWVSVCWSPELGLFCAVSLTSAVAATSPDGINWTSRAMPSVRAWSSVVWAPELGIFCAVSVGDRLRRRQRPPCEAGA